MTSQAAAEKRYSELEVEAPEQFAVGERCDVAASGCGRPLSRYNPYTVCGPCRMRLGAWLVTDSFPRRVPVRRGALGFD